MYTFTLALHNLIRWVVLILGVFAVYRALTGYLGKRAWTNTDRKAGVFFAISLDIQILIGLILYFVLSPLTRAALGNFGAAMGDPGLRFYALEHAFYMLLALVFAHVGSAQAKKAPTDTAKHQRALIWYGLAFLVVLIGIPWMRSLFPLF